MTKAKSYTFNTPDKCPILSTDEREQNVPGGREVRSCNSDTENSGHEHHHSLIPPPWQTPLIILLFATEPGIINKFSRKSLIIYQA